MDLVIDGGSPEPATPDQVRNAFDLELGFVEFVILSRGPDEFLQAALVEKQARDSDEEHWHAGFAAATAGQPPQDEDAPGPDLHVLEYRDATGMFGAHQVLTRAELRGRFLSYLAGDDGWRAGLTFEPIAFGEG